MTKEHCCKVRSFAGLARAVALGALCLAGLAGCGRGFVIVTPAGFAELESQKEYGYRATNAEGVVIGVRREDNRPWGDLAFWSGALDAQLRRQGYVADKALDLESADGIKGRQIRYHVPRGGREFVFWSTVFVTDSNVVVVEVGGDRVYFDKIEAAVRTSLDSLEVG